MKLDKNWNSILAASRTIPFTHDSTCIKDNGKSNRRASKGRNTPEHKFEPKHRSYIPDEFKLQICANNFKSLTRRQLDKITLKIDESEQKINLYLTSAGPHFGVESHGAGKRPQPSYP